MDYIYESRAVAKSRKTKWCAVCDETINIGEPSITITCFSGEFHTQDVCSTQCQIKFEENFGNEEE